MCLSVNRNPAVLNPFAAVPTGLLLSEQSIVLDNVDQATVLFAVAHLLIEGEDYFHIITARQYIFNT